MGWASEVQALLDRAAADEIVPGAVAVATRRDGTTELAWAGRLRVDGEVPVGPDTMVRLMSMTKAFASVAALQLIEQGRLELEQDVASVLPAFGELQVLEGFDGDRPRLRAPARQATIRNLLTHTAGHGYAFSNRELLRYHEVSGAPDPFRGLREGLNMPLIADPGTEWNYGINTDWLGQVIEAVSGQDLAAYLAEHVFGPLGMSDATFAPTDEQRRRLMAIHSRTADGGLAVNDLDVPIADPEFWPAGHGAYGTASDYARFMAALLGDGELDGNRILQPETVELAFSDHLDGIALPAVFESALPELSHDIPSLPFSQGWGLGFHLFTEDVPGMRRVGSGDWAGLCNTYFWLDRTSGIAVAFLTQVLPFFDPGITDAVQAIEQITYAGIAAAA
ncbi:MAG TPA: serine hydrolase domain-containing protein [Solirubrobacteraceae bacterium]|nr:serine hydrolase domain-containing protein [Solirubrobacteraceae bacterium]